MKNKKTICYDCDREFMSEKGGMQLCTVCEMEYEALFESEPCDDDIEEMIFNKQIENMGKCKCGSLQIINGEITRVSDCFCG